MKLFNKKIIAITGIYFIFLLLILFIFGYTPTNDGDGYIDFAQVCLQSHTIYPCYSLILGHPFIWNIGAVNAIEASLYTFHSIYPLLILYTLLKAFTAFFIAKTAAILWNENIALIAILLFILYPNNWGEHTTVLSEVPMIFLTLCGLYLAVSKEKTIYFILSGILFGLANWFRPIAIIFIGALILYFIIQRQNKYILKKSGALIAGYVTFILIVGYGCYQRTGYFIYQAQSLWFNMAEATYETSVAPHYNAPMYPKGTIRYIDNMKNKTAIENNEIWKTRSIKWLKKHPLTYIKKIPGRMVYMYFNDMDNLCAFKQNKKLSENNYITLPYRHFLRQFTHLTSIQYLAVANLIYYIFIIILFLYGIFTCVTKQKKYRKSLFLPLMIIIGGSLSIVIAIHGETRFKAPFMPFIFMVAAIGTEQIILKNSKIWKK